MTLLTSDPAVEKIFKQHPIPHENTLHILAELREVKAESQLTERLAQEEQQSKQLRLMVNTLRSLLLKMLK